MGRLLDTLSDHKRHQARALALILWRTGLRISEALALEWRYLDYRAEVPTLLVRESKSGKPRTVPLHDDLVALFTDWPAKHSPRDAVVPLTMRTALRHIGDGIRWAGLDEESPGTGKRLAGAHSLRHSAARHWLMVGRVPLNVVSSWLGHANVQVTLRSKQDDLSELRIPLLDPITSAPIHGLTRPPVHLRTILPLQQVIEGTGLTASPLKALLQHLNHHSRHAGVLIYH